MEWFEFAAALLVFFLSHSLLIRPPVKPMIQTLTGARGFSILYGCLSLGILWWLVVAAGHAPHVILWPWAPWQNLVPVSAMLPVCLLLALSIGTPNPFSFGGARNDRFDAARPGIVRWTRHPVPAALAIWAIAHVVPNGDLAHILLFGTFAGFAVAGGPLVDRRRQRELGPAWSRLKAKVATQPLGFRPAPQRLLLGAGLYLALLWGHQWLFGVHPLTDFR